MKKYRQEHPELRQHEIEYGRRWHLIHRVKKAEYGRQYRTSHKESLTEYRAKYRLIFPEKAKAHDTVNNLELPLASKCQLCNSTENLEKHHPNYDKPLEYVTLCGSCNMRVKYEPELTLQINE
jgi:hypothetical protein